MIQTALPRAVQPRLSRVATLAGWLLVVLSVMALAGWAFHLPLVRNYVPGTVPIKANTAFCFLLASLALLRRDHRDLRVFAAGVLVIGALTGIQYVTNSDFGIDQLLSRDESHIGLFAGRMSQVTSMGFVLLGSALFIVRSKQPKLRQAARGLSFLTAVLGAIALLGYAYDTNAPLNQLRPQHNVAIPTALGFIIAAIGVQYVNPREGLARLVSADNAGGTMLRRLLPASVAFPLLLAYVVKTAQQKYSWEDGFSIALGAVLIVVCLLTVIVHNASDLEREDLRWRESEGRFRRVANTAPVMIWMAGTDKLCNYFNAPWLSFTGRALGAELGNGWAEGVHPEDLKRCMATYVTSFDRHEPFQMEYRLRRHDGEYRWILDTGVPRFEEGHLFAGYIGSCIDITERRVAEEALADLERRVLSAQEEERSRIARELHDDINQRIAILGWELRSLEQGSPERGVEPRVSIDSVIQRLSQIGTDIQAISRRLHSSHLEYLGLATAAGVFCRDLHEQQQVEIDLTCHGIPRDLPKDISLCLYRVLQEALQNALKHSGMRQFRVELTGDSSGVLLVVSDEGAGFDQRRADRRQGLGLISMRERTRLVHGQLSIESEPGRGTTIRCHVPLPVEPVGAARVQDHETV
jgi:PAS domain S-box-containing protein